MFDSNTVKGYGMKNKTYFLTFALLWRCYGNVSIENVEETLLSSSVKMVYHQPKSLSSIISLKITKSFVDSIKILLQPNEGVKTSFTILNNDVSRRKREQN